jgi:trans-aconitate methyltransferase
MTTTGADSRKQHWENLYASKDPTQVSWYQSTPTPSLALISASNIPLAAEIIDIGGGASTLPGHLLTAGYSNLTVLELSASAIHRSRLQLGSAASQIRWIEADVLAWQPNTHYHLWHDRAVFHFLTDPTDRATYLRTLRSALHPGAAVILATFAPDGPERCSGLPVRRYSPGMLSTELGPGFSLAQSLTEAHKTPSGSTQSFLYCRFTFQP